MSAPVHREDEVEGFQLYAPPRVKERPPSDTPDRPAPADPTAAGATGEVKPLASQPRPPEPLTPETSRSQGRESNANARSRPAESLPRIVGTRQDNFVRSASSTVGDPNKRRDPRPRIPVQSRGTDDPPTSRRHSFEGDTGIKTLRQQLSLNPDHLEPPPVRAPRKASRSLLTVVAAVVVFGLAVVFSSPLLRYFETPSTVVKEERVIKASLTPQAANAQVAGTSNAIQLPARLIVQKRHAFANEALALDISLTTPTGAEMALISGLVPGTRLSIGSENGRSGWRLPARDVHRALAYPPKDFVGVMDTAIDVRTDNDMPVDSRLIQLEWLPKQFDRPGPERSFDGEDIARPAAAMPQTDTAELSILIQRGQEYLRTGDIAAARLVLRRAANAGDPRASLALGATFDPLVLGELGVIGFTPDLAQARFWYSKAADLGLAEASTRIERLARASN